MRLDQLELFSSIRFCVELDTSLRYSVFIMNMLPIIFPYTLLLSCLFRTMFSIASIICFASCLRVYGCFPSSFAALQISEYSTLSLGVPFLFICRRLSLSSLVLVDSLSAFSRLCKFNGQSLVLINVVSCKVCSC